MMSTGHMHISALINAGMHSLMSRLSGWYVASTIVDLVNETAGTDSVPLESSAICVSWHIPKLA